MVYSTLRFGPGVTQEIGQDLANLGCKKVLVLSDPNVAKLKPLKTVAESLKKNRINFDVYDKVKVEPTDSSWIDAIGIARKTNYDAFVAVGGGSTIDTAKAATLYAAHPEADFLDYILKPFGKQLQPTKTLKPLIAVPTTAGTGSETTTVAVFDFEKKRVKTAIRSRALKPHLALIDPDNVMSMPKYVAVYSGFDVLCHALESFTARPYYKRSPRPAGPQDRPVYQGSNVISDVWARETLRIIRDNFRQAVNNPDDYEARSKMLMASSFAGMGFGNAGVHLCHALSYPISGCVGSYASKDYPKGHPLIPHGLAVVTTACADFRFSSLASPEKHLEAAGLLGVDISNKRASDSGDILADAIRSFIADFGAANGLKDLGYQKSDIPGFVNSVIKSQPNLLHLCPREQTESELNKLYEDSYSVY